MASTDVTERQLIDFVVAEARLLDEKRYEEWNALFTDDAFYWVPLTPGQPDGINHTSHLYEDKLLRELRIERLKSPRAFSQQPPTRSHHLLQTPTVESADAAAHRYVVRSQFHYTESQGDETNGFVGTCWHHLSLQAGGLRMTLKYELPFGTGKRFSVQSRWANMLIGGWGMNAIYTFQTGAPITWVNGSTTSPGDYVYMGDKIVLNNRENNSPAFNTSAFDTKSADQFQYHIRTFSTTFGNLRQDGINELSPSVTKRFTITEKTSFQLRCEAYNVMNHPTFAAPNTTATNTAFGTINAQANRTRTIQLGARFIF